MKVSGENPVGGAEGEQSCRERLPWDSFLSSAAVTQSSTAFPNSLPSLHAKTSSTSTSGSISPISLLNSPSSVAHQPPAHSSSRAATASSGAPSHGDPQHTSELNPPSQYEPIPSPTTAALNSSPSDRSRGHVAPAHPHHNYRIRVSPFTPTESASRRQHSPLASDPISSSPENDPPNSNQAHSPPNLVASLDLSGTSNFPDEPIKEQSELSTSTSQLSSIDGMDEEEQEGQHSHREARANTHTRVAAFSSKRSVPPPDIHGDASTKHAYSNRPSDFFFFQQRFPEVNSSVLYEWYSMSILFGILFIVCVVIGIFIVAGNGSAESRLVDYSSPVCEELLWDQGQPQNLTLPQQRSEFLCRIDLHFPRIWTPPIYVYYEVANFYQAHRDYSNAYSSSQLGARHVNLQKASSEGCRNHLQYFDGQSAESNFVISPCGSLSYSMLNDSFILFDEDLNLQVCNSSGSHTQELCTSRGIVYSSMSTRIQAHIESSLSLDARQEKLLQQEQLHYTNISQGASPEYYPHEPTHPLPTIDDHFREWMRISPFRKLVKASHIISTPLLGNYSLYIHSVYPVKQFSGEKRLVFRQLTWFGSPNAALAVFYFLLGAVSGLVSVSCVGVGVARFIQYARNEAEHEK